MGDVMTLLDSYCNRLRAKHSVICMVSRPKTKGFMQALITPTYNSHVPKAPNKGKVVIVHSLWAMVDLLLAIGLCRASNATHTITTLVAGSYKFYCGWYSFWCGWCKFFADPNTPPCPGCFFDKCN